jgi:membrane protein
VTTEGSTATSTALGRAGAFLREIYAEWQADEALNLGAALAYYTIFSMAPLLLLVIAIAGLVLGRAAAEGQLVGQIGSLVGESGAHAIEDMLARASGPKVGIVASVVSLVTMVLGATGVFGQLQHALNKIWNAPPPKRSGLRAQVRKRAVGFGMILGIGFLLLVSLAISAVLAGLREILAAHAPFLGSLLPILNFALSFAVISALFALIFKFLPDVEMTWRDVWPGGAVTALLFTVGKTLIGMYLGRAGATSVYGAAGSFVLVLLWVYYSAQILFLGAEFTEVYSRRYGSRVEPTRDA